MKNTLLILTLLASIPSFGQSHKFRLGVTLNAGLTDNFLSNDGSVPDVVATTFKNSEKSTLGYAAHAFAQYPASARLKLQLGIGYAKTGFDTPKRALVFEVPEPSGLKYIKFEFSHHNITLPLQARYNFSKKKNTFYLMGGITPLFKLKRSKTITSWYADGGKKRKTEEDTITSYRTVNFNGSIGIGYDLKVAKRMNLFFQPTFDFNLLGVSKSASLNRRIYSMGLSVGLIFGS
ncbi:MAG: PorT family protein [Phycisphaerae bacterium]|nr:PorT family protein [Saprospiraceae bacterium]